MNYSEVSQVDIEQFTSWSIFLLKNISHILVFTPHALVGQGKVLCFISSVFLVIEMCLVMVLIFIVYGVFFVSITLYIRV